MSFSLNIKLELSAPRGHLSNKFMLKLQCISPLAGKLRALPTMTCLLTEQPLCLQHESAESTPKVMLLSCRLCYLAGSCTQASVIM